MFLWPFSSGSVELSLLLLYEFPDTIDKDIARSLDESIGVGTSHQNAAFIEMLLT